MVRFDRLPDRMRVVGLVAKSCPTLVTPWTVAPPGSFVLLWDFPQEYWSGLPFPSPGDLPNPGIKPESPALQAVSCTVGGFFTTDPHKLPQRYQTLKLNYFPIKAPLTTQILMHMVTPFIS